jgi:Protein of unknown function (DUF2845)
LSYARVMRTHPIAALIALSLPLAAAADSMRCGRWVVNETSSSAEILEKCGEPQQKEVREEEVYAPTRLGGRRRVGVQIVEQWTYQRSSNSLPMQVTVVDGKVVKLQRVE